MGLPVKRKPIASINITPLVDVLLILLVIMMLAMPLFAKRIPVDLPKTSLDAAPSVKQTLKLGLSGNGDVLVADKVMPLAAALALVTDASSVEIYPDSKVSYASLAKFISSIQERHPQDIALMSQ